VSASPRPEIPQLPGVTHRFVDAGDVRLHVAEAGHADAPPVVLLHGWPQHWWCWRDVIPRLAERYRVIAPDLRGWGWSDAPPGAYDTATLAADVVALLDVLELDRVRLVGHDWGGFVSFLLALEHPERAERLVALDIAPPWLGRPRPRHLAIPAFASYQVLVGTPGLGPRTMTSSNAFVRGMIRAGSFRRAWTRAELDMYASVLRDPARAAASSACYRTFLTREAPALASGRYRPDDLQVDTLLLMGARSPLQLVLDPRPTPRMAVRHIDGAGHFLPEEAPAEVAEAALAFFG
jgi:pimeloyl-ACP methyl ester carboxylesterase